MIFHKLLAKGVSIVLSLIALFGAVHATPQAPAVSLSPSSQATTTTNTSDAQSSQPVVSNQNASSSAAPSIPRNASTASPAHAPLKTDTAWSDSSDVTEQSSPSTSDLTSLIDSQLNSYLALGKFVGPAGPVGPQGSPGTASTQSIQQSVPASYFQAPAPSDLAGSIAGVTELSSQDFTTNTATVNSTLTVNGQTIFAGPVTASSLFLTSPLAVSSGGIGTSSLTQFGLLYGNGSGAIAATSAGTLGECLVSNGSSAPSWGSCAGGGSSLSVGEVGGSTIADVTDLQFDPSTGLHVTDLGNNSVKISIGSGWDQLYINGALTLSPTGEAPLNFTTGQDFIMTGNSSTSPQSLTLGVNDDSHFSELRASTSSGLSLYDSNGNVGVFVQNGGNIGIGNTSPASLLSVGASGQLQVSSTGNILLSSSSPNINSSNGTLAINTINNEPVTFGNGIVAFGSGQVTANNFASSSVAITGGAINGTTIGATTPSTGSFTSINASSLVLTSPLSVANGGTGTSSISGLIKGNGLGAFTTAVAGTDYEAPLSFSSGLTNTLGTVTNSLITGLAGGQTILGGTGATDAINIQGTNANGTLTAAAINLLVGNNGATDAMTVLNNGNVGIGTTAPASLLQVNGGITGNLIASPLYSKYLSYDAFGDSITYGYHASVPANDYVSLIGSALNITPIDHGVSGSLAADQEDAIYGTNVSSTSSQLFTYMIGTNDVNQYTANQQTNYTFIDQAELAWLAIPNQNKILGQGPNVTLTGSWSNSSYYGGAVGIKSTTNGSTITFNTWGPVIYIAYTMQDGNGGTFNVSVDGGTATAYTAAGTGGSTIDTTNLGRTYASALIRIPGLSYTSHSVVITVTSATGASNIVEFDWAASPAGNSYSGGPTVIAGGVPRQLTGGSPDAHTQLYTGIVKSNVNILASDGLNVTYADVPSYINPTTDITGGDDVHPNDIGMGHIRDAFLSAINAISSASNKQGALNGDQISNAVYTDSYGRVGIGNINQNNLPTYRLQINQLGSTQNDGFAIYGNGGAANSDFYQYISSTGTYTSKSSGNFSIASNNGVFIGSSGSDNFIKLNSTTGDDVYLTGGGGNTGVGTFTPGGIFQVNQTQNGLGTISVTTGSGTVTGSTAVANTTVGTRFTNTFKVGDTITANGETHTITAIASDTSMTTDNWTNTASNVAYTLAGGSRFVVKGSGYIGIGTASPSSQLQVTSAAGTSGASGTNAVTALTVTGGNGGNSSASSTAGGAGGAITLTSGAGGNSTGVAGTNGANITLQGGAGGTGSVAGNRGNIILQSSGGDVAIGNSSPTYLLQVGSSSVSGADAEFQNSTGTCSINPTTSTLSCSSDARLKTNITNMSSALQGVLALNPVTFNWKTEDPGSPTHPGFIAQQVQPIFPDVVSTDSNGYLSVGYSEFVPYLVSAIQSQEQEIDSLQSQVSASLSGTIAVYQPANFSGDSVGEAEILPGETSVRVSFAQAYANQPVVTISAEDVPVLGYITDKDSSGFTINIAVPSATEVTFDWHSFASPEEQLTLSDGTLQDIVLVQSVVMPTPTVSPAISPAPADADDQAGPTASTDLPTTSTSITTDVAQAATAQPATADSTISGQPIISPSVDPSGSVSQSASSSTGATTAITTGTDETPSLGSTNAQSSTAATVSSIVSATTAANVADSSGAAPLTPPSVQTGTEPLTLPSVATAELGPDSSTANAIQPATSLPESN